ncbi:MAG TPA: exodeoxyribonuclease VII small subunit [Dehalococcoidia bacterium]|nr:exodeoxyribonuclease VII small subunit [Dehalococcoidia bacterium]
MASKDEGFEPLYKRLEEIVARLEQGDLTLEESLLLYEEGMTLARRCQEMLQGAELRITKLQESFAEGLDGIRDEPAEYEPDAEEQELPLE